MMKLLTIAWKDVRLRFASPVEWLFFLILPLVFTVILAGGGGDGDARVRLAVVDTAASASSAELIAALQALGAVRPEALSPAQADEEFAQRRAAAVLTIPAGFDLAGLEGGSAELELRRQPNNLNAVVASRAVAAVVQAVGSAADIARNSVAEADRIRPFASDAARRAYFEASLADAKARLARAPQRVTVERGATPDQIEYDPRASASAGQLITWVFIPLIGLSGLFAYERQQGTLRRLLTTPTRRSTYLLGAIAGQVGAALAQMLLLVGFGIAVLRLEWGRAPAALALMLVASALAAAALGAALGAFVKTEGQANGLSLLFGMSMALLGGCWYPIELFPDFVRAAAHVLPTTWAMQGMLDILLRGQNAGGVLLEAGVLIGFAAVFFTIGARRFRYE